jgi:hypothetical protein
MSMTKTQTTRLLTHLSGKEAFLVLMQGYVERTLKEPPTFTDPEIERMMDAVWSNPQRASEFRRYQEAREVMETAMYEGKLAMAQAIISIQLQLMITSHRTLRSNPQRHEKLLAWEEEHASILQRQHAHILHWLQWGQIWQLVLSACDTVLSTRMLALLQDAKERMEMFIDLYHDRMAWYQEDIYYARIRAAEAAGKPQTEIDALCAEADAEHDPWRLPTPDLSTHHATLQRCIDHLHHCPHNERFYKVLEIVGVEG